MALAMIGAFVLALGGVRMARRKEDRGRGVLMIVAAAVIVFNVVIWQCTYSFGVAPAMPSPSWWY